MRAKFGPFLACALVSFGCPSQDPEPGEDCIAQAPQADLASLPARTVHMGEGSGQAFAAWAQGARVSPVLGGQGFSMLTPTLRLAGAEDPASVCYWVRLESVNADGTMGADGIGGYEGGLVFSGQGAARVAGPIFSPLESDEPGQEIFFRLTVASEEFVAEQMLGVVVE